MDAAEEIKKELITMENEWIKPEDKLPESGETIIEFIIKLYLPDRDEPAAEAHVIGTYEKDENMFYSNMGENGDFVPENVALWREVKPVVTEKVV